MEIGDKKHGTFTINNQPRLLEVTIIDIDSNGLNCNVMPNDTSLFNELSMAQMQEVFINIDISILS